MFGGIGWCLVMDVSGQPFVPELNVEGWREKSVTSYQPTPCDVSEDVGPQYCGGGLKSYYILLCFVGHFVPVRLRKNAGNSVR